MLLRDYRITKVGRSFCNPEWIAVTAELSDDIGEVLPYLNATIKNAVYTPETRHLNFRIDGAVISLTPRQVEVGQVACQEDAIKVLDYAKRLINDIWEKRASITPIHGRKGEIKAKDILDFLPRTNCRKCGLPTCFAFAMALLDGRKSLQDCPVLNTVDFAQQKTTLSAILQGTVPSQPEEGCAQSCQHRLTD